MGYFASPKFSPVIVFFLMIAVFYNINRPVLQSREKKKAAGFFKDARDFWLLNADDRYDISNGHD